MTTKNEEIALVQNVIMHPAGFMLNVLHGMLYIRSQYFGEDIEWEVAWQDILDGMVVDSFRTFHDPLEAAAFFVEKRHEMQCGIDVEVSIRNGD